MTEHAVTRPPTSAVDRPRRAVPLHWSALLGVVSLSCVAVLTITGVVLLCFYDRSSDAVSYTGSYPLLHGVPVSRAYASTLRISFEVQGGLLIRQTHHWAALLLPASLMLQMLTTFFTGGFRRPRQWSWVLLAAAFLLVLGAGWSGYALPDDLLAGTGLRIVEGILVAIPLVGTRFSFAFFGGEFPGRVIEHMYWLHVAVIPALLGVVLACRAALSRRRRPAQLPARGRTEDNVVGLPIEAVAVRSLGLSLITVGLLTLLGGLVSVNPIWLYGPASGGHASAGSQPDWYTAFLDGSLRLVPSGWEVDAFGRTLSVAVLLPQVGVSLFLALVVLWPFLEARTTRDRAVHDLLDRPREHPVRTAFGVSGLVFFSTWWLAGSTDIVTTRLGFSFEGQVVALRTLVILGPLLAFPLTRGLCRALVAREQEELEEGVATGRIFRGRDGGYSEVHAPRSSDRASILRAGRSR